MFVLWFDSHEFVTRTARLSNVAIEALAHHAVERDVALSVKVAFDAAYGPAWHCVVGRDYGSYVTHEVGAFVYFFVGGWSVLLFRADWLSA
ncbi:hypothetical protein I4F81_000915 [Pyropia yezoensis]|uniref:Uncharacterized protein n=1 Tax=Pyropia yezoensis TaxID=2788 RepID=A0ACC3BLE0_PYRYE|nr:hypothetical protein I4F81_000915 [Neopyropia yezoensis]